MGAKSSLLKESQQHTSSRNSQYDSSKSFVKAPDWSVVEEIPINDWKNGVGEAFGFDLYNDWFLHHLKVEKRPWSSHFTVTGRMPGSKQEERKISSFKCEVLETGRTEKVNWRIKMASVLAVCDRFMVIQVVVKKAVKILVAQGEFLLGTYTFSCISEPCLQECYISPDCSLMILRQNITLRIQLGHHRDFNHNLYVLRLKNGLVQRLYYIPDRMGVGSNYFRCIDFGSAVAFDPRVSYGQATILSTAQPQHRGVWVYDLQQGCQIRSAPAFTLRYITAAKYSPDGLYIATLCDVDRPFYNLGHGPGNVLVLETASFRVIHTIDFTDIKPCLNLSYRWMFPSFSHNGHFLATVDNYHNPQYVLLHQMPSNCFTLKEFCRKVILHHTLKGLVRYLPLPTKLLHFLRFIEITSPQDDIVDESDSSCQSLHWEVTPDF